MHTAHFRFMFVINSERYILLLTLHNYYLCFVDLSHEITIICIKFNQDLPLLTFMKILDQDSEFIQFRSEHPKFQHMNYVASLLFCT